MTFFDSGAEKGYYFASAFWRFSNSASLVFPFLEISLKDYKKKRSGSVLPLKEAFIYFRQIVETMVHIHHLHITHNDIKPENVLMFPDTGKASYTPHLCDFEYAIREGCPGRHGGTELFMPPEVCMS
jgi:serine/threonine protein kinase